MRSEEMPRWKQRLGGVFLMALGGGYTAWTWHIVRTEGIYYRKACILFPSFFVLGLGLLIFPGYKEERLARGEDISKLSGQKLITPRWWAVVIVGLLAGFANLYFVSHQ